VNRTTEFRIRPLPFAIEDLANQTPLPMNSPVMTAFVCKLRRLPFVSLPSRRSFSQQHNFAVHEDSTGGNGRLVDRDACAVLIKRGDGRVCVDQLLAVNLLEICIRPDLNQGARHAQGP
jgi:hypothetical protein